ncbi:MAG: alpha/beta hydrolase [Verrucomicrobiota bacterium]
MKALRILLGLMAAAVSLSAQTNMTFPLWPAGAPGALGQSSNDIPTLTVFLPPPGKASGAAMVICPGGGYGHLADHEGSQYARWFNELGIAGFVLKYRLGNNGYRHPVMLQDAARAMRTVRARAGEWQLDTNRVGIIGSSAGGHLASTLLTHWDNGQVDLADEIERQSSRPSLVILCYPVVTMKDPFTHQGSRANLLGTKPPLNLLEELSAESQVTKASPPCFLWHTFEDKVVPVENSLQLAEALRRVGVPFDLHIYQSGGHGLGLGARDSDATKRHPWTRDCEFWLKEQGFLK